MFKNKEFYSSDLSLHTAFLIIYKDCVEQLCFQFISMWMLHICSNLARASGLRGMFRSNLPNDNFQICRMTYF